MTLRLLSLLNEKEWLGRLVALRIKYERLVLREYVALAYHLLYWELDPKDRNRHQMLLETPPPGYHGTLVGTMWDEDDMLSAYEGGEEH